MNTTHLSAAERKIVAKWKKDYLYPDTIIAIRRGDRQYVAETYATGHIRFFWRPVSATVGDRSREYPITTTEWATATK